MSFNSSTSEKDPYKLAKMAALDLLSRREHTAVEIERKLSRRTSLKEVNFEQLCSELIKDGWLCHQRFAESFIRAKRAKGDGPIKITHALRQRGLKSSEYQAIFAEYDDWGELAYSILSRKVEAWPTEPKLRAKYQRFLQQRGFDFAAINFAINQLRQDTQES